LRCLDGHRAGDDTFGLLLLDADDPVRRKRVYLSLLDALYPHLSPGALVVAHDICVPLFAEELDEYRRAMRQDGRFSASLSLPIDACGLEVSRKSVLPVPVTRGPYASIGVAADRAAPAGGGDQ
jgi:predicted O-methyltransferase YrrM